MNEEEAIEEVKRIIECIEEIYHYDCDREDEKYLKTLLNSIDKYEKRITFLREEIYRLNKKADKLLEEDEELKEQREYYRNKALIIQEDIYTLLREGKETENLNYKYTETPSVEVKGYISEDKIKNKIKEIIEETQYCGIDKGETKQHYAIKRLKELLGDE